MGLLLHDYQTTVKSRATLAGIGVHSGKTVTVHFLPADADTGIVFHLSNGSQTRELRALVAEVGATDLCTMLGDPAGEHIGTVEHLMATVFGLGIDNLGQYPTLVTLCRLLNKRHGTIHTDSKSKVATALIYPNAQWPDTSDGCLRFLHKIDDIDSIAAPELAPLYGEFAVFKRCENSFHGHLPYEGERRVIQVAWLISEEEKLRKTKRGNFSRMFKKLFGRFDTRLGAGRDRNASHRD